MSAPLTPETLARLREAQWLLTDSDWHGSLQQEALEEIYNALSALLAAAEERDRLAAQLDAIRGLVFDDEVTAETVVALLRKVLGMGTGPGMDPRIWAPVSLPPQPHDWDELLRRLEAQP